MSDLLLLGAGRGSIRLTSPLSLAKCVWYQTASQLVCTGGSIQITGTDKAGASIADGSQTGLDPLAADFNAGGWIYTDSVAAGTVRILHKGGDAAGNAGWELIRATAALRFQISDGSTQATITIGTLTASTWYFWCVSCDRDGNATGYLNAVAGTQVDISSIGSIDSADAFFFGGDATIGTYFTGRLAATWFGTGTLSQAEVTLRYNGGDGTIGRQPAYYGDYSAAQQATFTSFWNANENEVDSTHDIIDQHGSNDLAFTPAEMATNGAFTTDTGWTKGTGWTVDAGDSNVAASDGSQSADADLDQACTVTSGNTYTAAFTISGYSAGNVCAIVGNTEGTDRAADGTHAQNITVSSSNNKIGLRADLDFVGNVDDFSVKATALLPANGPAAAIASDSIGTNHGTLTGYTAAQLPVAFSSDVPTVKAGAGEYSLRFTSASSNYVAVSGATAFTTYTIAAWVKPTTLTTTHVIFGAAYAFSLAISATAILATRSSAVSVNRTNTAGEWLHLAAVVDGTSISFFANGVQVGTTQTFPSASPLNLTALGAYTPSTGHFNGLMDDARVYNSALSPAQIAQLAAGQEATGATPVSRWDFNDGNQTVDPVSGDPVLGWESYDSNRRQFFQTTAANRPIYYASVAGLNNQPALYFDGSNDFMRSAAAWLSGTQGELWAIVLMADDVATQRTIVATEDEGGTGAVFQMNIEATKLQNVVNANELNGSTVLAVTTAYLLRMSSNDSALVMEVNGAAETVSGTNNGDWYDAVSGKDSVCIGASNENNSPSKRFKGYIAEVFPFNAPLTASEVRKLENYALDTYGITSS